MTHGPTEVTLYHNFLHAYLIMCGTETLEFSSNTLVIKPLQRILSMHWNKEQRRLILSVRDHLPVPAAFGPSAPPGWCRWSTPLFPGGTVPRGQRRTADRREAPPQSWTPGGWSPGRRRCLRKKGEDAGFDPRAGGATVLKTAAGTQCEGARLLTVLVAGVQLLDEGAFDQGERSSLLWGKWSDWKN